MVLAPPEPIVQIRGVRWLAMLAVLASSAAAGAEPRSSNPAFAGIGLNDIPPMGCAVSNLISGAPAKDAGVHVDDLMLAVDGVPLVTATGIQPCTVFQNIVTSHAPGDTLKIDLRRGRDSVSLKLTLTTRAEVLHRRFVGQTLGSSTLQDADDPRRTIELDDLRGHTTVLGWFHAESCTGCGAMFDRLRDALRDRLHGDDMPELLAVTSESKSDNPSALRKVFSSSVALAIAPRDTPLDAGLLEANRIHFLIIDARGIVRCVSPIVPDSDDVDAALDEVLAGVEQQEHATRPRR